MLVLIGISGKKQSGKDSLASAIKAWYYTSYVDTDYTVEQDNSDGSISLVTDNPDKDDIIDPFELEGVFASISSDINNYSFADSLKEFCIDVLGFSREQCYGTDEDKNSLSPYEWESLPLDIHLDYLDMSRLKYYMVNSVALPLKWLSFGKLDFTPLKRGRMTVREVMQVLGTNFMRNCFSESIWIDSTFRKIESDNPKIALIPDVRFLSEVKSIINHGGHIIRLTRSVDNGAETHASEVELDNFDFSSFDDLDALVIDNSGKHIDYKNNIAYSWIERILQKEG